MEGKRADHRIEQLQVSDGSVSDGKGTYPALSLAAFDFHTSLTFIILYPCVNPIPKTSSLVSWSQIFLLNSIAVFETGRSYLSAQPEDRTENIVEK